MIAALYTMLAVTGITALSAVRVNLRAYLNGDFVDTPVQLGHLLAATLGSMFTACAVMIIQLLIKAWGI